MKTKMLISLGVALTFLVLLIIVFLPTLRIFLFPPKARVVEFGNSAAGNGAFSFERYGRALAAYVDDDGMVNYGGLKANSGDLDAFGRALAVLDPTIYQSWSDPEKIAFWINAYNALTLKAIIDHYPIRGRAIGYPSSSIRQIPGVWTRLEFIVMGQARTLDEIEHQVLRKEFTEPRIHVALVCAAMSCPPLRNEPFTGEKLDEQLKDQTRRFVASDRGFQIDRNARQVRLSSIFSWFGKDFNEIYGTDSKFEGHKAIERAVLNYISSVLDESDREYLETGDYSIHYLSYDWSLNERRE